MNLKRLWRRKRLAIVNIAKLQAVIFAIAMRGISLISMSVFTILDSWEATRNFQHQYVSNAGPESIHEQVQSENVICELHLVLLDRQRRWQFGLSSLTAHYPFYLLLRGIYGLKIAS